jgi:hypothetical protein
LTHRNSFLLVWCALATTGIQYRDIDERGFPGADQDAVGARQPSLLKSSDRLWPAKRWSEDRNRSVNCPKERWNTFLDISFTPVPRTMT